MWFGFCSAPLDPYDNRRASGRLLYVTLRLGTLDSTSVVEWMSKDTNVSYQVYKRVWPATQRESLFWSTIRHCPAEDEEGPDYWIVTNHSTEHPEAPVRSEINSREAVRCETVT